MGVFDSLMQPATTTAPPPPTGVFGSLLKPIPPVIPDATGLMAPPSDPNAVAGQTIVDPGAKPPVPTPPEPSLAQRIVDGARSGIDQGARLIGSDLQGGANLLGAGYDAVVGPGASGQFTAMASHLANEATGNVPLAANALLAYGYNHLLDTGPGAGKATLQDAMDYERRALDRQYAEHPVSSNVGTVVGMVGQAAGLQKLITKGGEMLAEKGVPAAANALSWMSRPADVAAKDAPLVEKIGTATGNVARAAATGATVSGLQSEIAAPNFDSRLGISMVGGALLSPVIGKAMGMAAEAVAPYAIKLANAVKVPLNAINPDALALARKLGVDIQPNPTGTPDANPEALAMFKAVYPSFKSMGAKTRQAVLDTLEKTTGARAPLVAAATQAEGNATNALGTKYPVIGEAVQGAAQDLRAAQPKLQADLIAKAAPTTPAGAPSAPRLAAVTGVKPTMQDLGSLGTARGEAMDAARKSVAGTAEDWSQARVTLTPEDLDLLTSDGVRKALAGTIEAPGKGGAASLRARVGQAVDDLTAAEGEGAEGLTSNVLSVNDLDNLRQTVGRFANAAENSHNAGALNETRDAVASLAAESSPSYGQALEQFKNDSNYIRGFRLGEAKANPDKLLPSDMKVSGKETPDFKAGYTSGIKANLVEKAESSEAGAGEAAKALTEKSATSATVADTLGPEAAAKMSAGSNALQGAQAALDRAAPKTLEHQVEPDIAGKAAGGVAAAAVGMGKTGMAQLMGILKSVVGKSDLSPATQKLAADMMLSTDPVKQRQFLAWMDKMGASQAEMKMLQSLVGAVAAAPITNQIATGQR